MAIVPVILRDLIGLAGAASIAFGAWMLHPAAGFIVGGVLALAGALALGRAEDPAPTDGAES
jgi:hypothetical protein